MDNPACQVIYVHENVTHDGLVDPKADPSLNYLQDERIRNEVLPLLDAFGDGLLIPTNKRMLIVWP
jgi:hypothetical protein